jgi:hypothetical protein
MKNRIAVLGKKAIDFLNDFSANKVATGKTAKLISGDFALYPSSVQPDLYGMVDAVYVLSTLGVLAQQTTLETRTLWAERILDCQETTGWFTKRNLRGHSREHATAYAIGALKLLEVNPNENYLEKLRPIPDIMELLSNSNTFLKWLKNLDFSWNVKSIVKKQLGWHYIWRGSHVGGGIPAIAGMTKNLKNYWLPGTVDQRLEEYFDWLDTHINPITGYWQRAFWNSIYRKPTIIDMGGAVHFLWVYEAFKHPFPYPEAIIASTLKLQKKDGLYKNHPYCIDLDGNFCLIRAYLQLHPERQEIYREDVYRAAERNFEAIVKTLTENPLHEIYRDSHGLPGALVALVECTKLPGFKYSNDLLDWKHPLDKTCWL